MIQGLEHGNAAVVPQPVEVMAALMAAMTLTINAIGSVTSAVAHRLAVVPETEQLPGDSAESFTDPTSNAGVSAVRSLGDQPRGKISSPCSGGCCACGRSPWEITIAPGGHIGLHRHYSRPGVAYPLEGRHTERQGPAYNPVVLQAGEAAFETTGVTGWWRNETSEPVRALVVDIVEASTP